MKIEKSKNKIKNKKSTLNIEHIRQTKKKKTQKTQKTKKKQKTSKKAISVIIMSLLLIVIIVILMSIMLGWGEKITTKQIDQVSTFSDDELKKDPALIKSRVVGADGYNEIIIVENITAKATNTIVAYKILDSENENNYDFINTRIELDVPFTLNPGGAASLPIVCYPNRKFHLLLYTNKNTTIKMPISVYNYNPNSCAQYYATLNPPTVTVNSLTTTNTTPDLNGTISNTTATLSLVLDGTIYTPINLGDGTWSLTLEDVIPFNTYDVNVCANLYDVVVCDTTTNELTIEDPCPDGYILVPNDPTYNTGDFCVMQFEAKMDNTGDGIGDSNTDCQIAYYKTWSNATSNCAYDDPGNSIVSTIEGYPLTDIDQAEAVVACESLGDDYHLITNNEWMTIVRNIEAQEENWSNSIIGDGYIPTGNSDGSLALDDDTVLTGINKRNLVLSNGNEIWDLSGNVSEWVDQTITRGDMPLGVDWLEYTSISDYGLLGRNAYNFEEGKDYNSSNGIGAIYSDYDNNSLEERPFRRGGSWSCGNSYAGLLFLGLYSDSGFWNYALGFRCVVVP
jgi:hypothetical protein